MEITRKQANNMFDDNYCPRCGCITTMTPIKTGMPGILKKKCLKCKGHFVCNFLESDKDIIPCPDHFLLPKE